MRPWAAYMMSKRLPLLIGESPSKSGDRYHMFPLSGAVGKRLCEFAGIEPEAKGSRYGRYYWALRDHFDCVNLSERYPGKMTKDVAQKGALRLGLEGELWGRTIICLGRTVANALGFSSLPFYTEQPYTADSTLVVIPHPSALNRLYNAEEERHRASCILRKACSSTPG